MQKLIYRNLSGEQIDFFQAPYVLSGVSGLGLPDIKYETLRGAYQQGDTVAGFRRENRVVGITFSLMETDRRIMYSQRMYLLGVLSPDKAINGDLRATLLYENDFGRFITSAVPSDGLDAGSRFLHTQPNIKLRFKCESPYWYDDSVTSVTFAPSGGGLTFPFAFPIEFGMHDYDNLAVNTGQVAAPVEITIQCKGETPRLYNRTTGKELAMSSAIPNGYTLILNTDPAKLDARVIDSNGNESGAFGKLSLSTPLADFMLQPGSNMLAYEAGGARSQSTITVAWRSAYEGV